MKAADCVTLRDLVKDGLTMSLDTYCIGEIVGVDAGEFLQGAVTGHRGRPTSFGKLRRYIFETVDFKQRCKHQGK